MRWRRSGLRGASRFEFAVVLGVIGVLIALLLQRLDATLASAHQVQLRMAAEQLRLQAEVLALRCGDAFDPACWQRLLDERRLAPGQAPRPEAAAPAPTPDARGRLRVLARAAGLMAGRDESHADWLAEDLPGEQLQLALRTQPGCRLVVGRPAAGGRIEVQVFSSDC